MTKSRLEAFSDGVVAIIITIMVLELRAPHDTGLAALRPLVPAFLSYLLSFVYVGIYWNNHHHLLHAAREVNGWILWANLHLLFWLSLFPFATAWVGENPGEHGPAAFYGFVLLMASVAYPILERALIAHHGRDSALERALRHNRREWISMAAYATAIALAWVSPWLSHFVYVAVALLWFLPDRRIEAELAGRISTTGGSEP